MRIPEDKDSFHSYARQGNIRGRSFTADAHTTNPEGIMYDMGKRVMQSERETCAPFVGPAVDILHLLSVHWGAWRLTNLITHKRNWTIKKK